MVVAPLQRLLSGAQLDRTCVAAVHTSSDQLVSGEYQEDVKMPESIQSFLGGVTLEHVLNNS